MRLRSTISPRCCRGCPRQLMRATPSAWPTRNVVLRPRLTGRLHASDSSQLSPRLARHNSAMRQTAARLVPALFALALVAFAPSSALVAQGQRQGGAGGGAQGGAFGQGGGGRNGQLPPRDQTGGAGTGDQAAGTAIIRGRVVSADNGTPVRRAQVRAQSGELRANRLVSTDAQGRFEFKDLPAGRWNLTASKAGYMSLRY